MTDRPIPFPGRAPRPSWRLTVVASAEITPRVRRVSLIGNDLGAFSHRPGQDLVLNLAGAHGETCRRHYTIRSFDREEQRLEIDFVLHGASPATRWATDTQLGDTIVAEGPRGRTVVNGPADWRLFTGDETALPGIAAMIESLPAGERAFAIVEIAGPEEEQPIETHADMTLVWLYRGGPPRASSEQLIGALAAFDLPPGVGQACVIGETGAVRAQRQGLIARGMPKTQIAAEGYWRPGRVGGHDHIVEPDILAAFGRGRRVGERLRGAFR
jgi:NADPH-dependent ferric siderophore reductase